MKICAFLAPLCLVASAAGLGAAFSSQDDAEMQAKWQAFMTPGPEHKVLDARLGKWTGKVKMWMTPGMEAMESTCTTEYTWALGKRFLINETHGSAMGMEFEGRGMTAYDNLKKKYVGTWVDTMGTGIMVSEGTYEAGAKTFSYMGEGPDVMAGKYTPVKTIERDVDANSWVMEMHCTDPQSGKLFKTMEITYSRAK